MFTAPQFSINRIQEILKKAPDARAAMTGGPEYPKLQGTVSFYQTSNGVLLAAQIHGLPVGPGPCPADVFGFHIHEGTACSGTREDPFADAGGHFNPHGCPHPAHAGDLPPLFGNQGYAFLAFFTDRFSVNEVIGRTVIIHAHPDDFTTQPSGNSGAKIACGRILSTGRRRNV